MADKPETLTAYRCPGGHRTFKREPKDSNCTRCGAPFRKIATLDRLPGESENHHQYRALSVKEQVVN